MHWNVGKVKITKVIQLLPFLTFVLLCLFVAINTAPSQKLAVPSQS